MSEVMEVKVIREGGGLHGHATDHSAGIDLMSSEDYIIMPEEMRYVKTGIVVAIPRNHYGMVASRSGIGTKQGIIVAQGVGIIDADYRGELMVPIYNRGHEAFHVYVGDRVAQLIVCPYTAVTDVQVEQLDATMRGAGGFGSTG